MNVKQLKNFLEEMEDGDRIYVEFPDMGKGDYIKTNEVIVETVDATFSKRGKVVITANLL